MILSIIAAIGKNNELGKDNQLLWDLPVDMKHFRETTSGHPVIMGRKTFESIGRALPNRRNVVITRDKSYTHDGIEVVHSLEEALQLFAEPQGKPNIEVFIIGGAEMYRQAIELADKLYITYVDGIFEADTFFPLIDPNFWIEKTRIHNNADEKNNFPCDFVTYEQPLAK